MPKGITRADSLLSDEKVGKLANKILMRWKHDPRYASGYFLDWKGAFTLSDEDIVTRALFEKLGASPNNPLAWRAMFELLVGDFVKRLGKPKELDKSVYLALDVIDIVTLHNVNSSTGSKIAAELQKRAPYRDRYRSIGLGALGKRVDNVLKVVAPIENRAGALHKLQEYRPNLFSEEFWEWWNDQPPASENKDVH